MFGSIGFPELALIFIVVILLFGPEKLPEFAKFFGKTVRTIRETMDDAKRTIQNELDEADVTKDIRALGKELDPYKPEDSNEKSPQ